MLERLLPAAVLSALVGVDPRDPATSASAGRFSTDYTKFLDPNGLRGARIGVTRQTTTGYSTKTDAIYEEAIAAMKDAGAVIVDPADIPTAATIATDPSELTVLIYDFRRDLNSYLATRTGLEAHTLADLIAANQALADRELPFCADRPRQAPHRTRHPALGRRRRGAVFPAYQPSA